MSISGFSYVHNAISVGIPIREAILAVRDYVDEVVIVDAESTDGTREFLEEFDAVDRVLDGKWGNEAGETLARLHAMHVECKGDTIIHMEGDEIFSDNLISEISHFLRKTEEGIQNIAVYRLQTEANYQRMRWYPEIVHRVFPKGSVKKQGHTTDLPETKLDRICTPIESLGFLWDITNCFRDNWMARVEQQARLWNEEPKYRMVPLHFSHPIELTREQAEKRLKEDHWTWSTTPLDIPEILKPLVGVTKYHV